MKNIHVIGIGLGTKDGFAAKKLLPVLRKSSRNMILAYDSVDQAFASIEFKPSEKTAFIFGSSHGEIETTEEFLVTFADLKMARPILFQNSLHNSTAGFLAMQLKFYGPTLTISSEENTGEDALNTALTFLNDDTGEVKYDTAVVTVTECIPVNLIPAFQKLHGLQTIGEGAVTFVFCNDDYLKSKGLKKLATLEKGFSFNRERRGASETPTHDSESLTLLAQAVLSGCNELHLQKKGGFFSHLHWDRP